MNRFKTAFDCFIHDERRAERVPKSVAGGGDGGGGGGRIPRNGVVSAVFVVRPSVRVGGNRLVSLFGHSCRQ